MDHVTYWALRNFLTGAKAPVQSKLRALRSTAGGVASSAVGCGQRGWPQRGSWPKIGNLVLLEVSPRCIRRHWARWLTRAAKRFNRGFGYWGRRTRTAAPNSQAAIARGRIVSEKKSIVPSMPRPIRHTWRAFQGWQRVDGNGEKKHHHPASCRRLYDKWPSNFRVVLFGRKQSTQQNSPPSREAPGGLRRWILVSLTVRRRRAM